MKKIKVAIIGKGYWGNILYKYVDKYFDIIHYGGRELNIDDIQSDVQAFFIATPVETHYELAKKCLGYGKYVFVEKPTTTSSKECLELIDLAEKNNVKIYTDYPEAVADSRLRMKSIFDTMFKNDEHIYIEAITNQLGKFTEHDVLWVLGSHQLSMLSLFVDLSDPIICYEPVGHKYTNKTLTSGSITFFDNDACIGSNPKIEGLLKVSLNHPIKEKKFTIHGDGQSLIFDAFAKYPLQYFKYNNDLNTEQKDLIKYTFQFDYDEKNNLDNSVKKFKDIIEANGESNEIMAYNIVKILEI